MLIFHNFKKVPVRRTGAFHKQRYAFKCSNNYSLSIVRVYRRSLATVAVADRLQEETSCDRLQGLVRKQKGLCKRNFEVMGAVRNGAKMAIDECQHQFKNRRWNCSTVDSVALFGNVLKTGT